MRKIAWGLGALVCVALVGFFVFAPVERGMNKVVPTTMPQVSDSTRVLHASLQIADMHGDTLLWSRDLIDRAQRGQIDLPRLIEGNVALQVFSSVTKTPKAQNYDSNGADSDNITLLAIAG
jgi:membrane dipeptidase